MLFNKVKIKISNMYDNKILADLEGELLKQKADKCLYLYHVGEQDIDKILWELVDRKISIDIISIAN